MIILNEMMRGPCMGAPGCAVKEGRKEELWVVRRYASVHVKQSRPWAAHMSTLLDGPIKRREEEEDKKRGGSLSL